MISTKTRALYRFSYRKRGFWLRCLLCWIIGCLVLSSGEQTSYDLRFQLRGTKTQESDVVLITIRQNDVTGLFSQRGQLLRPIHEISEITDSFFWDRKTWHATLAKLLAANVRSVGVTFFFGDNLPKLTFSQEEENLFQNPKVIWSASLYNRERPLLPVFARNDLRNVASNDLEKDEDGVYRRFVVEDTIAAHMAEKLANKKLDGNSKVINYVRGPGQFTEYYLSDLLMDQIPKEKLQNKIIIIGPERANMSTIQTPVGPMTRSEIMSTLTDNLIKDSWIRRAPPFLYWFALFILMLISVFIITQYPQTVAFVFLIWLSLLLAAFSAWIFDTFSIWIPAFAPFLQLSATWIVFVGYQASKIEQKNWQLQQEQRYLRELEQLKNNFVSLISHDLKTPIAKIQAVLDRLNSQYPDHEFKDDLLTMRKSSEELHRYIQSILKLLRVESRDFKISKDVGDINEIIAEALLQIAPLAREKSISIDSHLEPMFSLEFDPTLIKEVVLNLLENAIKYTPPGGSIVINSMETENSVVVSVQDTGEGISPEELENVWGKFVRGKNQDLRTKGTGLGLYLVKYFIELHDGKVLMTSELGKGTKVAFTLPIEDSANT